MICTWMVRLSTSGKSELRVLFRPKKPNRKMSTMTVLTATGYLMK